MGDPNLGQRVRLIWLPSISDNSHRFKFWSKTKVIALQKCLKNVSFKLFGQKVSL